MTTTERDQAMKPRGHWMRPSLTHQTRDGRNVGHLNFGPLQINWGYTPGVRVYLTWPGRTRTLSLGAAS